MKLRLATMADLEVIMGIMAEGIATLKQQQSPQWQDGYGPNHEKIKKDIEMNACYLFVTDQDEVVATAALIQGTDPVYTAIQDGSWQGEGPYVAIHRVAVAKNQRGKKQATLFLSFLLEKAKALGFSDVRIDTHRLNQPMQKAILANHFIYRGTVFFPIPNGERLAYQRIL